MQLPGVCCKCGRTIQNDFVYCPWCGVSQIAELVPAGVPEGHASHAACAENTCVKESRLSRISRTLDELERDFTLFAYKQHKDD
ncbi:MAG: hypothetical protein KBT02_01450 [Treponema sp.]|nr:hypothetical protein [Candidatus Treponema caballi]